jgi:hypothetical protein
MSLKWKKAMEGFHGQQESTGRFPVSCQAVLMPDDSRTPKKPAMPKGGAKKAKPRGDRLGVIRREQPGGEVVWELAHPRCSRQRKEDLEEVEAMLDAGEAEIARDELIWLLSECPDFLDAHVQLGLIALEDGDPKLARGHFGRAYELVLRVVDAAGVKGPLPYSLEGNRVFFEAAKGLAHTLVSTGRSPMARDLLRRTLQLDPSDTLGIRGVVEGRPPDSCGG